MGIGLLISGGQSLQTDSNLSQITIRPDITEHYDDLFSQ